MTKYLVALWVGPVQDFIAAARRTADLYAGSELLVRVVGAAAGVFEGPHERIFPVSTQSGGANKILAIVQGTEQETAALVGKAKAEAFRVLKESWETQSSTPNKHLKEATGQESLRELIDGMLADAQLADFLELFAAWVPLPDESQYSAARERVEKLLLARKATRNFEGWPPNDGLRPKSPLDPSRACVFKGLDGWSIPEAWRGKPPLHLKADETLDAISVLKRMRGASLGQEEVEHGRVLSTRDLAQRAFDLKFVAPKPKDDDSSLDDDEFKPVQPYYAVLLADGDLMGNLLKSQSSKAQHVQIAEYLDNFAKKARELVKKYGAQRIYEGGDDVLALLPVSTVLDCARELAQAFKAEVNESVSLSVGVAINHYLTPLGVALDRVRAAERKAKETRNTLAVALHPRSGDSLLVTQGWDQWDDLTGLKSWLELANQGRLPRGVAYELRELAREWPGGHANVLRAEAKRILERKQQALGEPDQPLTATPEGQETVRKPPLVEFLPEFPSGKELAQFAELLVLTRFLSRTELLRDAGDARQAPPEGVNA